MGKTTNLFWQCYALGNLVVYLKADLTCKDFAFYVLCNNIECCSCSLGGKK